MAFNRIASAVCLFAIALLHNGLVTCNPSKRQAQEVVSSGHSLNTGTSSPEPACQIDPGLENRTINLENAAKTWAKTLPPMLQTLQDIASSLKTKSDDAAGMDCTILHAKGKNTSGIYKIAHHDHSGIAHHESFYAYCDMETDGGGWTVFQRRSDGSTDFYRGWEAYTKGFGHLNGEHWLGLDKIYLLTSLAKYELRIDLESFDGNHAYAQYDTFRISDEIDKYKLVLGSYTGTAGDAFTSHSGQSFTTKDRDNDIHSSQNCAQRWTGGWWYYDCHISNLNGQYLGESVFNSQGVVWQRWKESEVLKFSEMKIRRKA